MRYRRNDSFRYEFEEPVPCVFTTGNDACRSNEADGKIHDISLGGLKLITPVTVPLDKEPTKIEVSFELNNHTFFLKGEIVWGKSSFKYNTFGMKFNLDEVMKKELVKELKVYSRGVAVIKNKV